MEAALKFSEDQGEIIIFETNESLKIPVHVENETVWLSQAQMAQLFGTSRNNVTMHIRNIFKE